MNISFLKQLQSADSCSQASKLPTSSHLNIVQGPITTRYYPHFKWKQMQTSLKLDLFSPCWESTALLSDLFMTLIIVC